MQIKSLLSRYGLRPNSNLDQYYLQDEKILEREIEAGEISKKDTVLQIGAGPGLLTKKLAQAAKKVIAIEKDRRMAQVMSEELSDFANVEVIAKDCRQAEIPAFDKSVSNIPYSLSKEITKFLGERGKLAVVSYQLEFAQKITAQPEADNYSEITVVTNYYFIPVFLQEIPQASFYPEPEVNSALVKLYPRQKKFGIENKDFFLKVVKALFMHQRKKLRNSFYDSRHLFDLNKKQAKEIRDQLPYHQERVVNLSPKQLADVSQVIVQQVDNGSQR